MPGTMTRPPAPPAHTALGLWSLSLAYFAMGTASIAVVGLVNGMAADLGVSKPDIAVLITVFALTFALAAPLLQVAAGSLPRRTLLLGGLTVLAAGCLLSAWAPRRSGRWHRAWVPGWCHPSARAMRWRWCSAACRWPACWGCR